MADFYPGYVGDEVAHEVLANTFNGDDFAAIVNDHILAGAASPRLRGRDRPGMSAPCRMSLLPPRWPPAC
jgi:hypothetical protein